MNVLQLLTLNPDRALANAEVLPPAKDLPREPAYTKMSDLTLAHPLDVYVERDASPIPITADRELYHGDRHFDYWLSGLADALRIFTQARQLHFTGAVRVSSHVVQTFAQWSANSSV